MEHVYKPMHRKWLDFQSKACKGGGGGNSGSYKIINNELRDVVYPKSQSAF